MRRYIKVIEPVDSKELLECADSVLEQYKDESIIKIPKEELIPKKFEIMKGIVRTLLRGNIDYNTVDTLLWMDLRLIKTISEILGITRQELEDFIYHVFATKGKEYSGEEDRLRNFKVVADIVYSTPYQTLMTYKAKGNFSIDYILKGNESAESTLSRVGDDLAYYILLLAMIVATLEVSPKEAKTVALNKNYWVGGQNA